MSMFSDYYEQDLFDAADARIDAENANKPFDFDKEIIAKIDGDVADLGKGYTAGKVVTQRYNLLKRLDGIPAYHGIAREYWLEYRNQVLHQVHALYPNRPLRLTQFPTW